jgi:hypothetical protein
MSNNINYSIQTAESGSVVMRSNVTSFNLDHVTDKDIVSFYRNFSSYAMFDTGLMPNSATGVLAVRSAGNHTQITFQHQAQINYINWGASEGDRDAKTYLVAQPYRIWIGDLVDGDMFGARMFYSPYPITSPDQPLYHLNLPNTNCKGYRGNGVGWQCLYHKDSWQQLPFNEKIIRFAERCSGVETYNDANMSETDGPRFYQENNFPSYIWDPTEWQEKTAIDGLDWVLDSTQWIPILVKDQDHQDKHYSDGVSLTIQMAMLGDYQGYYTDPIRPKPINSLTRSDLRLNTKSVVNWIARAYNSSSLQDVSYDLMDATKKHRINLNTQEQNVGGFDLDDQEEEEDNHISVSCPVSGLTCHMHEEESNSDFNGTIYCQQCFEENVAYCENTDEYIPLDNPKVKWIENDGIHINIEHAKVKACSNCQTEYWTSSTDSELPIPGMYISSEGLELCKACLPSYVANNFNPLDPDNKIIPDGSRVTNCYGCSATVLEGDKWSHHFPSPKSVMIVDAEPFSNDNNHQDITVGNITFCPQCSTKYNLCPTGHYALTWSNPITELPKQFYIQVKNPDTNEVINTSLTHLCYDCISQDLKNLNDDNYDEALKNINNPFSENMLTKERYEESVIQGIAFSTFGCTNLDNISEPF